MLTYVYMLYHTAAQLVFFISLFPPTPTARIPLPNQSDALSGRFPAKDVTSTGSDRTESCIRYTIIVYIIWGVLLPVTVSTQWSLF